MPGRRHEEEQPPYFNDWGDAMFCVGIALVCIVILGTIFLVAISGKDDK